MGFIVAIPPYGMYGLIEGTAPGNMCGCGGIAIGVGCAGVGICTGMFPEIPVGGVADERDGAGGYVGI